MLVTVFISIYSTRLVLLALGAEDYGIFSLVGGLIAMMLFLNTAMIAASQRFMSYYLGVKDLKKQKEIFNVSFILHLATGVLLVVVMELCGYFFFENLLNINQDRIEDAYLIYHFVVVSSFFTILSASFNAVIIAHENMLFIAVNAIFQAIYKFCLALLVTNYFGGYKLIAYSFLFSLMSIITFIIMWIYCRKKYSETIVHFKRDFNKNLFVEMGNFAKWSLLGGSATTIAAYGQGFVLNIFFGTVVNAAQGVANQLRGQLEALSNSFMAALNPAIVKSEGAGERKDMFKFAFLGCKVSFFLLFICGLPMIIEAPYILKLWLVKVPENTVIFVRLMLILSLVNVTFSSLRTSISAIGDIKKFQIVFSIVSIAPLIVSYGLFSYGLPAHSLYLSFIGFSIVKSFIVIFYSNKLGNLDILDFIKKVLIPISIMGIIGLAISLVIGNSFEMSIYRIFTILLLNFIFSTIIFVFLFINKEQRENIYKFVNNKINKY